MPEGRKKTLVIWFANGETAYFSEVTALLESDSTLGFRYFGKETQVSRDAIFERAVIAGYAVSTR